MLIKFADNTKAANIIRNKKDWRQLQQCLDALMAWATKLGMAFKAAKCKVPNARVHWCICELLAETK